MANGTRDTTLQVRVSTVEKERIRRAAELTGVDLSTFVLQHVSDAADAVLAERSTFSLTDAAFERFLERLDEPARVLPGLAALAQQSSPFSDR